MGGKKNAASEAAKYADLVTDRPIFILLLRAWPIPFLFVLGYCTLSEPEGKEMGTGWERPESRMGTGWDGVEH